MVARLGNVAVANEFNSFSERSAVLRSLLTLALVCSAWTMPAMAGQRRHFDVTPERRALLNTIRFAEGTWRQGKDGYRVQYGGGLFHDLSRHPNQIIRRRYSSDAAGAYQFLPTTWRMAKKALQLQDFGPVSQDQAALYLIQRRKALGLADRGVFTRELAHRLAPEWASFPKHSGDSYYGHRDCGHRNCGQRARSFSSLRSFYRKTLAEARRGNPSWFAAGPPPTLTDQATALAASNGSVPHPTPTRWIPVASSADCDGELMCLLDHVARGGAPIHPEIMVSRS